MFRTCHIHLGKCADGRPDGTAFGLTTGMLVDAMERARATTLALVEPLTDAQLIRSFSPLMSPLVWDLAHIGAYEDLWLIHRQGRRALLRDELAAMYDAFETPRAVRADLPLLGPDEARGYLAEVRSVAFELLEAEGAGDGLTHELVIRHEQQHNETMLQALQLARIDGYTVAPVVGVDPTPDSGSGGHGPPDAKLSSHSGLEFIEIPAGPRDIGAEPDRFSYDNERPRHRVDVGGFCLGRTPVTNESFLAFVQDGGYERPEYWSAAGWSWIRSAGVNRPGAWSEDNRSE